MSKKIDLGNRNYKLISGNRREINSSNIQEVEEGTFGSWKINNKFYIIGEGAETKFDTNKITMNKKALLGKALFPYVTEGEKVDISTMLPLSLYAEKENRDKFKELLKGKYVVETPQGNKKTFSITNVDVCCEGYSSLVTDARLLKMPIYLVDIGGVDLSICYVDETPVAEKSTTSENGMNIFFEQLAKKITAKELVSYSDRDAENLMKNYNAIPSDLKTIIDDFAKEYIEKNIYKKLKKIGYKPIIHKLVFVGGGSVTLNRYISSDENARVLDDSIWTNVEGAGIISESRKRRCG